MKRMQATIDALAKRVEELEEMLKTATAPVEATAQDLETKFTIMTKDLHEQINASVKATVDATMDVTKNELKAFAKSLVPAAGGKKKGSSPAVEELAQE